MSVQFSLRKKKKTQNQPRLDLGSAVTQDDAANAPAPEPAVMPVAHVSTSTTSEPVIKIGTEEPQFFENLDADLASRPPPPSENDYNTLSVEAFGQALLRGLEADHRTK